jgi:hypothetical protein
MQGPCPLNPHCSSTAANLNLALEVHKSSHYKLFLIRRIIGSHSGCYEGYCRLVYDALHGVMSLSDIFRYYISILNTFCFQLYLIIWKLTCETKSKSPPQALSYKLSLLGYSVPRHTAQGDRMISELKEDNLSQHTRCFGQGSTQTLPEYYRCIIKISPLILESFMLVAVSKE